MIIEINAWVYRAEIGPNVSSRVPATERYVMENIGKMLINSDHIVSASKDDEYVEINLVNGNAYYVKGSYEKFKEMLVRGE